MAARRTSEDHQITAQLKRKLFDLEEISKARSVSAGATSGPHKDAQLALRFLNEHYERIESVKALVNRPPAPGETYFLFTEKSFNAFTFVPYLVKERGHIDELVLSTYSINKRILLSFMNLVEKGSIASMFLLVADSLRHQRPAVVDLLDSFASTRDELRVKYAWNHSKMLLARCGQDHFVIEGSGNWSENSRHEQYLFCNSQKLYGFRYDCINSVCEL